MQNIDQKTIQNHALTKSTHPVSKMLRKLMVFEIITFRPLQNSKTIRLTQRRLVCTFADHRTFGSGPSGACDPKSVPVTQPLMQQFFSS